jgi:hypothetical protein
VYKFICHNYYGNLFFNALKGQTGNRTVVNRDIKKKWKSKKIAKL